MGSLTYQNDFQIRTRAGQQFPQRDQKHIDLPLALMNFIDNDMCHATKVRIVDKSSEHL
jgi:hypothetical protein